jgi:hypothetical protein
MRCSADVGAAARAAARVQAVPVVPASGAVLLLRPHFHARRQSRLPPVRAQRRRHHRAELPQVHRLGQVVVGASLQRLDRVFGEP